MSYFLSPINAQIVDANGAPLSGGKIYTYIAGTTTATATYTDSTGGTQQANPIILNSLGVPTSPIWLQGGTTYKFVIKNSADVTQRTIDGISGVNDISTSASEWNESGFTPTYINATQFSVPGDQTSTLHVNRRVRTRNTGGYIYGRITVSNYSASITTVTVVNDSGTLDSGLSAVAYGFLSFSPASIPYAMYAAAAGNTDITGLLNPSGIQFVTRADVASAATVVLTSVADDIRITGTTTITAFTVAVGRVIRVTFSGSLTLTNNSGIVTQTGANIITQAGDTCLLRATAANTVEVLNYSSIQKLTANTAQSTTSGTSIDFTSIPSWVKRITVALGAVSTNGTSLVQVQIGDSGGVETTSYVSTASTNGASASSTTGFLVSLAASAAQAIRGALVLTLVDPATNLWSASGAISYDGTSCNVVAGSKALSATLDRVRLTTVNGTDVFDAGSVNILYE